MPLNVTSQQAAASKNEIENEKSIFSDSSLLQSCNAALSSFFFNFGQFLGNFLSLTWIQNCWFLLQFAINFDFKKIIIFLPFFYDPFQFIMNFLLEVVNQMIPYRINKSHQMVDKYNWCSRVYKDRSKWVIRVLKSNKTGKINQGVTTNQDLANFSII